MVWTFCFINLQLLVSLESQHYLHLFLALYSIFRLILKSLLVNKRLLQFVGCLCFWTSYWFFLFFWMTTGETFILFNKQIKGNKRELIQLGVPIFGHIREEPTSNNQTSKTYHYQLLLWFGFSSFLICSWSLRVINYEYSAIDNFLIGLFFFKCFTVNIEPIPTLLQGVIEHLVQWQLIPEYKKPNGCIINFFDEVYFFAALSFPSFPVICQSAIVLRIEVI